MNKVGPSVSTSLGPHGGLVDTRPARSAAAFLLPKRGSDVGLVWRSPR